MTPATVAAQAVARGHRDRRPAAIGDGDAAATGTGSAASSRAGAGSLSSGASSHRCATSLLRSASAARSALSQRVLSPMKTICGIRRVVAPDSRRKHSSASSRNSSASSMMITGRCVGASDGSMTSWSASTSLTVKSASGLPRSCELRVRSPTSPASPRRTRITCTARPRSSRSSAAAIIVFPAPAGPVRATRGAPCARLSTISMSTMLRALSANCGGSPAASKSLGVITPGNIALIATPPVLFPSVRSSVRLVRQNMHVSAIGTAKRYCLL